MAILCTLFAGQAWGDVTWELVTDYSTLSTSDTYVIAGNIKGGTTWYSLKNNKVVTAANLACGQTLTISGTKITSTITEDDTWKLESTGTTGVWYIKSTQGSFYLQNTGATKSTINAKNTTNDSYNQWKIHYEDTYIQKKDGATFTVTGLYNVGLERELACYSSSSSTDWRCYLPANYSNIAGAEVVLYKKITTHTLTYSATNGSIGGVLYNTSTAVASGASVAEGGKVTLTAEADPGYVFDSWEVSGTGSTVESTGTNTATFTMGTANATVTANFLPAAGDYITANPTSADIDCNGDVAEFELTTNIASPSYSVAYYTTSAGDVTTDKPSWLGDVEFSGNTLDIVVNKNTTASARTAYLKVYSGTTYSPMITINQAALTVNPPSFDPVSGTTLFSDDVVLLSCTTPGATIYYTMGNNPADPTNASTPYDSNNGIEVTASTTIKAIAYVGEVASTVATATYTLPITISAVRSQGTGNVFTKGIITYINGKNAYIQDDDAAICVYSSTNDYWENNNYAVGDEIAVSGSLTTYANGGNLLEITGPTVTKLSSDNELPYVTKTIAQINTDAFDDFQCLRAKIEGATVQSVSGSNNTIAQAENTILVYSGSMGVAANDYITSFYANVGYYSGLQLINPTDVQIPTIGTDKTSLSFTYVAGGSADSKDLTITGSNLTAGISVSVSEGSSYFEISADEVVWGSSLALASAGDLIAVRLKSGLAKGNYEGTLTLSSTHAQNVTVSLSGSVTSQVYGITLVSNPVGGGSIDAETTVAEGASVTATANAEEHYTFTSWTAEGVTLADNTENPLTFTMPSNNVSLTANFTEDAKYTATFYVQGVLVNTDANVYAGEAITFPTSASVTAPTGYTFMGWTTAEIVGSQNAAPAVLVNSANMGDGDVAYYAVFAISSGKENTYTLVSDEDDLQNNDKIILVSTGSYKANNETHYFTVANGALNSSNIFDDEDVTISNDNKVTSQDVTPIEMVKSNDNWLMKIGDSYLTHNGNKAIKLTNNGTIHDITIDDNSIATIKPNDSDSLLCYNPNSGNNGRFTYYKALQKAVSIYKKDVVTTSNYCTTVTTVPVTVTDASYATFACNLPLDFTGKAIKAYIAEGKDGATGVTFRQVNKIPAGTGVLLYKDGGATEDIPVTTESTDYTASNVFGPGTGAAVASETQETVGDEQHTFHNYILNNINGNVGFYKAAGKKVAKNRAYIRIDVNIWGSLAKEFISLPGFDDDDPTGVETIDNGQLTNDNEIYNLAGQRVNKAQKGIYIVNGKKVMF